MMREDFLSLANLTGDEIVGLIDLADDLKGRRDRREDYRPLKGRTIAMIFEKPSLRTRVTFEIGIFQLGGYGIFYQTRLGERESVEDIARNLERWVDGIVARTFSHADLLALADNASVPVINALTDREHPCQILADAQALRKHRGSFDGLKVAFVGDGNNVFASWVHFAARIPIQLTLVCPKGYEPTADIIEFGRREVGDRFTIANDLEAVAGADAVYTDVWASMGQEDEAAARERVFAPYQVNSRLMAMAGKDALFMHCLPAHRGSEVTDDVIDSPRSIVFDEAENRLHVQKAVMLNLMK